MSHPADKVEEAFRICLELRQKIADALEDLDELKETVRNEENSDDKNPILSKDEIEIVIRGWPKKGKSRLARYIQYRLTVGGIQVKLDDSVKSSKNSLCYDPSPNTIITIREETVAVKSKRQEITDDELLSWFIFDQYEDAAVPPQPPDLLEVIDEFKSFTGEQIDALKRRLASRYNDFLEQYEVPEEDDDEDL